MYTIFSVILEGLHIVVNFLIYEGSIARFNTRLYEVVMQCSFYPSCSCVSCLLFNKTWWMHLLQTVFAERCVEAEAARPPSLRWFAARGIEARYLRQMYYSHNSLVSILRCPNRDLENYWARVLPSCGFSSRAQVFFFFLFLFLCMYEFFTIDDTSFLETKSVLILLPCCLIICDRIMILCERYIGL